MVNDTRTNVRTTRNILYHLFLRFHEEEYKIAMAQSAKIGEVSGEESARYGTVF